MSTYLLSVPRTEALALPIMVEQTTSEPTPIWKIESAWNIYAKTHCTQKGTMKACKEPYGIDIITPGASTVAEFMTITAVNLRDSSSSRTERQVNALIMSCLFTHPVLLTCRVKPTKRLGVCWGMESIGMRRTDTPNQIVPASKVLFYFQINERKCKKMLKFAQKVANQY